MFMGTSPSVKCPTRLRTLYRFTRRLTTDNSHQYPVYSWLVTTDRHTKQIKKMVGYIDADRLLLLLLDKCEYILISKNKLIFKACIL